MGFLDTEDQWNNIGNPETIVSVHSPIIKCTEDGQFYTSYTISLKTSNSCFNRPHSCVKRRYSEFMHLRNLLKGNHPTMDPPELPPRKYFHRFDQSFINERTEGLQNFLKSVIDSPVYLSDKSVHLFLQSKNSMTEIVQQVTGKFPAPKLMPALLPSSYDSRGDSPINNPAKAEISTDCDNNTISKIDTVDAFSLKEEIEIAEEATSLIEETVISSPSNESKNTSEPIPILQAYLRPLSPESNLSSSSPQFSPGNSSTDSAGSISRHVSFCDKVKVAIVKDKLWDFGTKPIRNC